MTDPEKPQTLTDVIARHQEWMRYGEYLVSEATRSQRSEAESYCKIRDVFDRAGMRNAAIVDTASQTVYFMGADGLVCSRRLEYAGNINLEFGILQNSDDVVQLGEAS